MQNILILILAAVLTKKQRFYFSQMKVMFLFMTYQINSKTFFHTKKSLPTIYQE